MTSGCASTRTEYVYVTPECTVPVQPSLPSLPALEVYNKLGVDGYNVLVERESRLVTWALEMEAILNAICKTKGK